MIKMYVNKRLVKTFPTRWYDYIVGRMVDELLHLIDAVTDAGVRIP